MTDAPPVAPAPRPSPRHAPVLRLLQGLFWVGVLGTLVWLAATGSRYQDGWWGTPPPCLSDGTCTDAGVHAARTRLWLAVGMGAVLLLGVVVLHVASVGLRSPRPDGDKQPPRRALGVGRIPLLCLATALGTGALALAFIAGGAFFGAQVAVLLVVSGVVALAFLCSSGPFAAPRRGVQFLACLAIVPVGVVVATLLQSVLAVADGARVGFAVFLVGQWLAMTGVAVGAFLLGGGRLTGGDGPPDGPGPGGDAGVRFAPGADPWQV